MTSDAVALADEIDRRIRALPEATTEPVRAIRREYSGRLRGPSCLNLWFRGRS